MNHIIPMRNERSTAMLYMPCWFSPMTVWNQKMNSSASIKKPGSNAPRRQPVVERGDGARHQREQRYGADRWATGCREGCSTCLLPRALAP